jgi:hypothetical protein
VSRFAIAAIGAASCALLAGGGTWIGSSHGGAGDRPARDASTTATPRASAARERVLREARQGAKLQASCGCRHRWPGTRTLPATTR